MACKALYDAKVCTTKIVTQNVDGLHQRTRFPRTLIAELHGSVYKERCSSCERVYARDFDDEYEAESREESTSHGEDVRS